MEPVQIIATVKCTLEFEQAILAAAYAATQIEGLTAVGAAPKGCLVQQQIGRR